MACLQCNKDVPIENEDTGLCASCNKESRSDNALYPIIRINFLKRMIGIGAICPVTKVPVAMDFDIHHIMGRVGYADDWARRHDISLLIDPRFFLAVTRFGHGYIEAAENRKEAIAKGWIRSRLTYTPTYDTDGETLADRPQGILPNSD